MVSSNTLRTTIGAIGRPSTGYGRRDQWSNSPRFPYIAGLLSCMMWLLYGLPVVHPHSTLLITTCSSGLTVELLYVVVFLLYSQGRKRLLVFVMLVASIASVGVVALLVITLAHTHERRSMIVGVLGGIVGIVMYGSPLSVMKMVLQTKSVEYMPLFLSLATLFNSVAWTAYAFVPFDPYICVPNTVGVGLALAQLLLYALYYKSTQRQIEARRRKEETAMAEIVEIGNGSHKVELP